MELDRDYVEALRELADDRGRRRRRAGAGDRPAARRHHRARRPPGPDRRAGRDGRGGHRRARRHGGRRPVPRPRPRGGRRPAPPEPAEHHRRPATTPPTDEGSPARISLRLPDGLKGRAEAAAAAAGTSLNSWLVRAVAAAVRDPRPAPRPGAVRPGAPPLLRLRPKLTRITPEGDRHVRPHRTPSPSPARRPRSRSATPPARSPSRRSRAPTQLDVRVEALDAAAEDLLDRVEIDVTDADPTATPPGCASRCRSRGCFRTPPSPSRHHPGRRARPGSPSPRPTSTLRGRLGALELTSASGDLAADHCAALQLRSASGDARIGTVDRRGRRSARPPATCGSSGPTAASRCAPRPATSPSTRRPGPSASRPRRARCRSARSARGG